jgi:hypothetical protein
MLRTFSIPWFCMNSICCLYNLEWNGTRKEFWKSYADRGSGCALENYQSCSKPCFSDSAIWKDRSDMSLRRIKTLGFGVSYATNIYFLTYHLSHWRVPEEWYISLEKYLSICTDLTTEHTHAHNNGAEGIKRETPNRWNINKKRMVEKRYKVQKWEHGGRKSKLYGNIKNREANRYHG